MLRALHVTLYLAIAAACNFPRPSASDARASDDADALADASSIDAPEQPGTVIRVSPFGDDANDGVTDPVKTLKRAIGLAGEKQEIRSIVLASGRYSTAGGETFPYTVPASVTIIGPAGGGAILVGTKTEIGLMLDTGELKNLELEDFTASVVVTGVARATNVRVRSSAIAIRAETAARLAVDNLDVTGTLAVCSIGVVLNGTAELAATTFATRNLGIALDAKDQSVVSLLRANIAGDAMCNQAALRVTTSRSFELIDSLLDSGSNGMSIFPRSSSVQVIVTNTIIRNMKVDGIQGAPNSGGSVVFKMNGGELSSNGNFGGDFSNGSWTFNDVTLKQNISGGIYLQEGTLVMRRCSITDNDSGVYLLLPTAADLGTVADPGNNILRNNANLNLYYDSSRIQVEAVGNIWSPGVQGADGFGRYAPAILQGHISPIARNNYAIICDTGQCTLHR